MVYLAHLSDILVFYETVAGKNLDFKCKLGCKMKLKFKNGAQ